MIEHPSVCIRLGCRHFTRHQDFLMASCLCLAPLCLSSFWGSITTSSKLQRTHKGRVFVDTALEPHAFFILSSSGTIQPVHFNASALFTLLSALDGHKL